MNETDIYPIMYQQDDEDNGGSSPVLKPTMPERGIMNMAALSSEVRRLKQALDDQTRLIKKLELRLRMTEQQIRTQGRELKDVAYDVGEKMDRF